MAIRSSSNLSSTITRIIDNAYMSLHLFLEDYNNLYKKGANFNFSFSFGLCNLVSFILKYFLKVTSLAMFQKLFSINWQHAVCKKNVKTP